MMYLKFPITNFLEHWKQIKTRYKESCRINKTNIKIKKFEEKVAKGYVQNYIIYVKCQHAKQCNKINSIQTFRVHT